MMEFSSGAVTCLARSMAPRTCCWCWDGEKEEFGVIKGLRKEGRRTGAQRRHPPSCSILVATQSQSLCSPQGRLHLLPCPALTRHQTPQKAKTNQASEIRSSWAAPQPLGCAPGSNLEGAAVDEPCTPPDRGRKKSCAECLKQIKDGCIRSRESTRSPSTRPEHLIAASSVFFVSWQKDRAGEGERVALRSKGFSWGLVISHR